MTDAKSRIAGLKRYGELSGPEALLISVIAAATTDALGPNEKHRQSALCYFAGPVYQHHMSLLGLPRTWLPEGVSVTDTRRAHVGVD